MTDDTVIWEKTKLYCPYCGTYGVEVENGPGDFYDGPEHRCTECKKEFRGP